jgi:hypothetical protein
MSLLDWLPAFPTQGPPLPGWAGISWSEFWAVRKREIADLKNEVAIQGSPTVLPDLIYLLSKSISSAAISVWSPEALANWEAALNQQVAEAGQFTQFSVFYRDLSPPPLLFDYKCSKCLAWGPNNGMPAGTCKWVSGSINGAGWCAIWCPAAGEKPFGWPKELIKGDW